MPAPTLLAMAQRACGRNVQNITDFGDLPYELIRPALRKIDNPQHLVSIERATPHIADYDGELWREFIRRDIPDWQTKMLEPKNPRSWWKVYRKLMREEQERMAKSQEALKLAMRGEGVKKEESKTVFLKQLIPGQVPRPLFLDGQRPTKENGFRVEKAPRNTSTSTGASLKNAKTGHAALTAIKKQSGKERREMGFATNSMVMRQPARILAPSAKQQIIKAPKSMVMQFAPRPPPPPKQQDDRTGSQRTQVFQSSLGKQPSAQSKALQAAEQAEKEARLRALTQPKPSGATSPLKSTASIPPVNPKSPPLDSSLPARTASPAPPPIVRKRPPANVFLPAKKRKVGG